MSVLPGGLSTPNLDTAHHATLFVSCLPVARAAPEEPLQPLQAKAGSRSARSLAAFRYRGVGGVNAGTPLSRLLMMTSGAGPEPKLQPRQAPGCDEGSSGRDGSSPGLLCCAPSPGAIPFHVRHALRESRALLCGKMSSCYCPIDHPRLIIFESLGGATETCQPVVCAPVVHLFPLSAALFVFWLVTLRHLLERLKRPSPYRMPRAWLSHCVEFCHVLSSQQQP